MGIMAHQVGSSLILGVRYLGQLALLFFATVFQSVTPPFKSHRFFVQAKRVGPGSFFIAGLVALFVGMIIALQMAYMMVKLSAEIYIPTVISVALTRELAPVLTALIVAGRIGAGITAEIGSMVVTEQVDALRAFAINPIKYLVVPRFLALMVMLPLLTIFADIIGVLGGAIICVFKLSIGFDMYVNMVLDSLFLKDIFTGLLKTVFFGMIIAIVGCHHGLGVRGGADGVGQATTKSVVHAFIFIIMADCFITFFFYFLLNI